MQILIHCIVIITSVEMAVLDPALYLSPTPPMTTGRDNIPTHLWLKRTKTLDNVRISTTTLPSATRDCTQKSRTTPDDVFAGAETFWPNLRFIRRDVHIPLTFHLTGTYGGLETPLTHGVIGSSYAGLSSILRPLGYKGKSALAGSIYGSSWGDSGVRIYGGDTGPAWSGWGNGKWGHYGKG